MRVTFFQAAMLTVAAKAADAQTTLDSEMQVVESPDLLAQTAAFVDYFMGFLNEEIPTLAQVDEIAQDQNFAEVSSNIDSNAVLSSYTMADIHALCGSDLDCEKREIEKRTRVHVDDQRMGNEVRVDTPHTKKTRVVYDDSRLVVDNGGPERFE